ncbi:MAG: YicC family protein [Lentisphaerae bacterium]|nr:YicC family protein [Lentisphaerota bacterium]
MPVISMTGFGRGDAVRGGVRVEVEVSSVNRKQLDVRFTMPRALSVLEARAQMLVQGAISRGQVAVNVRVSESRQARDGALSVNRAAAAAGVRALRGAAAALGLPDRLGAEVLLQIPGVLVFQDRAQDAERVWPALEHALGRALAALRSMRRKEGVALERDVRGRLRGLDVLRRRLAQRAPLINRAYERKLRERIDKAGLGAAGPDDPQVLKEILLFVDRADVSEELVRLQSHFDHAAELMSAGKPAGRSLDFLCQEMFREINTIGSKCGDSAVSRLVVAFKSQLEAIREQIQNVE